MHPRYPIYVVSKGRAHTRLTMKALDGMGAFYRVIIPEEDWQDYAAVLPRERLITLPKTYELHYDTCDQLGLSKPIGPGAARNYALFLASQSGYRRHWVMDDNLDAFHRLNNNIKAECDTQAIFCAAEDFVDRYENVPVAGFNYYSFCKSTDKVPPFYLNTRIYSCLLLDNHDPDCYWRGRYNEDTDLSLRVLKKGKCTIQFNAFLCGKVTTQRMKGGNTEEFYRHEGTLEKSKMIAKLHPDVAKVVWKFGRWHHHVNYKPFKNNKLIRKEGWNYSGVNNYGMTIVEQLKNHERGSKTGSIELPQTISAPDLL